MRVQVSNVSMPAETALDPHIRVKITLTGTVEVSGATDLDFGVTAERAHAAGDMIGVSPINATGTIRCVAAAAVLAGGVVYGAANGKIAATVNANPIGYALNAAAGDGGYVEVMPRWGLPTS